MNVKEETKKAANIFNNFFSSVGDKLANKIIKCGSHNRTGEQQTESPINTGCLNAFKIIEEDEICKIIKSMKGGTAPGFDRVTVEIIKENSNILVKPLTFIINQSIKNGIFPEIYKKTKIIPIFKSGDKTNPTNYRPISLTSNIAKIYEKVIKKRLLDFVNKTNLLNKNQFGFRENIGTNDAIAKLTTLITNSLDNHEKCAGIFIDLQKAFDSVSHEKLISKLKKME